MSQLSPVEFLSDFPCLLERTRSIHQGTATPDGDFVLYWMHHAVRAHENPALDVAIRLAGSLSVPLLVYHAVCETYEFACDRHHTFIIQGARDVQAEFRARGIPYVFHVERPGHRGPWLRELTHRAMLLVTEEVPVQPVTGWLNRLTQTTNTPIWAVDTSCVVPMQLVGREFTRAFQFRSRTQKLSSLRIGHPWQEVSPVSLLPFDLELPFQPLDLQQENIAELVASCEIDHSIGPVPHTRGGSAAGYDRWQRFCERGLRAYARTRNNAAFDGVSRMSAYLHYGMVSPFRIAAAADAVGGDGAEKFLDELLIWRELAWSFCFFRNDHSQLSALPDWAVQTLREHQSDRRPAVLDHETLSRGRTGDRLWDAAQRSLLQHGELHNNVRMTWGKAVLNWTESPEAALKMLIDLNHRYALDGRDPASYGGLLWCLGQFDRPFAPEQPILGTVRPRPTADHARRLNLDAYIRRVSRPLCNNMPVVAVIGAGISGLACARVLADHGVAVTVFDKGRRPGGRMSTRESRTAPAFDHGCQFFSAEDRRFVRYVDAWHQAGIVEPWAGRIVELSDGRITEQPAVTERWVGVPGMNAVCQHLAGDLQVRSAVRVDGLRPAKESPGVRRSAVGGWQLVTHCHTERSLFAEQDETPEVFDCVILAIPPAQACELLGGITQLSDIAGSVRMSSSWTLMTTFSERVDFPADGAAIRNSPLSWIARNSSKPGRAGDSDAWVLQASPDWTRQHLEKSESEIEEQLLKAFSSATRTALPQTTWVKAHRWRYAVPNEPLADGCLFDFTHGIGLCGDWCHGNRVEAAFLSGIAAAGRLLGSLADA